MSDQQVDETIANEAAFVKQLGLNPDSIEKGSVRIEFANGRPVLRYVAIYTVPPHLMGLAFMAAAGREIVNEDEEQPQEHTGAVEGEVVEVKQPTDHQPKKRAAKKQVTRKADSQ